MVHNYSDRSGAKLKLAEAVCWQAKPMHACLGEVLAYHAIHLVR